jgi:hypothetical protein
MAVMSAASIPAHRSANRLPAKRPGCVVNGMELRRGLPAGDADKHTGGNTPG